MRYIKIKDLQPGMILAQPLLNKRGDIFLARNVSVSKFMVQRIREEQYKGVYVYDKLSKGINPKNQLPADVQLKTMCALKDMDIDRCAYLSGEILALLKHADNISMNINSLAAYDSSTYMHSLNVAMYAGTFGLLYGMEYERVSKLIAAALLHDIGKTKTATAARTQQSCFYRLHQRYSVRVTATEIMNYIHSLTITRTRETQLE